MDKSFNIVVNNITIEAFEGETILSALRRNGINVPTLCYMKGFTPTGACRLCVVEVNGVDELVTSCSYPVYEGMQITTNSLNVINARKSLVELLLSNHPDDCLYCVRNSNCELQKLAEELGIKERKYFGRKNSDHPDSSSPSVLRDQAKCILCSRCVRVCEEEQYVSAIDFVGRGNNTKVNSAFKRGLNISSCINCGQCITVCPTGALSDISHIEKVTSAINKKYKVKAFVSNSTIVSIAEMFNLKPNDNVKGKLITALQKIGFHRVNMLSAACDLNIALEAQDLADKVVENKNGILLSSCCPAWIKFVEEFRPDLIEFLSPAKSPQQIMGSLIKSKDDDPENLFNVSIIPCTAKKYEAAREEMIKKGISDIDAVITVRELLNMIKTHGIDFYNLPASDSDDILQQYSSASFKVGYSGGKAKIIAREVFKKLKKNQEEQFKFQVPKNNPSKKETTVKFGNHEAVFARVSGIANAIEYLNTIDEKDKKAMRYVEVMACPGGCVGGGGHPINLGFDNTKNRKKLCIEFEKQFEDKVFDELSSDDILKKYFKLDENENIVNSMYAVYKERNNYT